MDCVTYMHLPMCYRIHQDHWEHEDWISGHEVYPTDAQWSHGSMVVEPEPMATEPVPEILQSNHGIMGALIRLAIEELDDDFTTEDVWDLVSSSGMKRDSVFSNIWIALHRKGYVGSRTDSGINIWRKPSI